MSAINEMKYPESVPVKELKGTHNQYCMDKMEIYNALYSGGSEMTPEIKRKIIVKRANEVKFQPKLYNQRVEKAGFYINRSGGLIDWVISSSTKDTPRIVVSKNATPEQAAFWLGKNINADGKGTPFATIFRKLLKDQLVSRVPYLQVLIDDNGINLDTIDPEMVVDWGDGWIKTYGINTYKISPFTQEEYTENIWTIYTAEDTVVYKAVSKQDAGQELYMQLDTFVDDDKAEAYLSIEDSVFKHDFAEIPIYRTEGSKQVWLMDRISENVCGLYNAETDLAWVLSESAYPQGIINLESEARFQEIYNKSESNIWNLLPGEDYKVVSSTGTDFEAQFKNVDRLKESLHESMQMLAREAAAIPQAGRLSGEAVREMRTPLDALLQSFLWPILDITYEAIESIKRYRNEEDLGVWIEGLNTSADELQLRKILFGESIVVAEEEKEKDKYPVEENEEDE